MNPRRPAPRLFSLLMVFALLVGSALAVKPVSAASIVVSSLNDSGAGSLRQAILDIPSGGTITFSPGLSGLKITLTSSLVIEKHLTIDGSSLSVPITLSGNNEVGVFMIGPSGEVTLDSLKIINGNRENGGGIFNMGALTIINGTIAGNYAQEGGGGIFNSGNGDLTIRNSTLSNNTTVGDGGGIFNMGLLAVENSTLSGNTAGETGGGVHNEGTLTLLNVALNGNKAGVGGGIYTNNTLIITDSTLSGNSAYEGGGIYNLYNLMINNSTLFGNTASYDGGGILNVSTLNITNSTLSGNTAKRGGGILNDGSLNLLHVTLYENIAEPGKGGGIINFNGSTLDFINTIIAHSTGGDCVINGTIDLESTHNLVTDDTCGALFDDDPLLGTLANNGGPTLTHALLPGSPAIDAGHNDLCPMTDQRGVVRPYGVGCDMGSFESHPDYPSNGFINYLPLILIP